jgi:hypothetical protein
MPSFPLPSEVTPDALRFCRSLCESQSPQIVGVMPAEGAIFAECFHNVIAHAKKCGGSLRYGWDVSILEGVYGEAEFHAVWRKPDGTLLDITPKAQGEDRILFQPDDVNTYDFDSRRSLANRFCAFCDDPLVLRFVELAKYRVEKAATVRAGTLFTLSKDFMRDLLLSQLEVFRKYVGLDANDQALFEKLTARPQVPRGCVGRNEQCPCGSGRKHKKCCGA